LQGIAFAERKRKLHQTTRNWNIGIPIVDSKRCFGERYCEVGRKGVISHSEVSEWATSE
jgi:hypothetical protein